MSKPITYDLVMKELKRLLDDEDVITRLFHMSDRPELYGNRFTDNGDGTFRINVRKPKPCQTSD